MKNKSVPPPPPEYENELPWADDTLAKEEDKYWADEEKLRGQKTKNDILWLKVYGFVVVMIMVIFAMLFLGSLTAWAFHYLTPICWHWLDDNQLSKIQSVIFSGSLGGIVSFVAQKQLSK